MLSFSSIVTHVQTSQLIKESQTNSRKSNIRVEYEKCHQILKRISQLMCKNKKTFSANEVVRHRAIKKQLYCIGFECVIRVKHLGQNNFLLIGIMLMGLLKTVSHFYGRLTSLHFIEFQNLNQRTYLAIFYNIIFSWFWREKVNS